MSPRVTPRACAPRAGHGLQPVEVEAARGPVDFEPDHDAVRPDVGCQLLGHLACLDAGGRAQLDVEAVSLGALVQP